MKIIGKRHTDNALLKMQGHLITDAGHSIGGTINVDVLQTKLSRYVYKKGSRLLKFRGGYRKNGKLSLFCLASRWTITQTNGALILTDRSKGQRIDRFMKHLIGQKIKQIEFNGRAPMFTVQISRGLFFRVFSESGQYYPGWDVTIQTGIGSINYDYKEFAYQEDQIVQH